MNRIKTNKYRLKYRYGISLDDFRQMVENQNGLCAICNEKPYRLVVDHNHNTGKIRNLLCDLCNKGLGLLRERPDIMEKMIEYIKNHNE